MYSLADASCISSLFVICSSCVVWDCSYEQYTTKEDLIGKTGGTDETFYAVHENTEQTVDC